MHITNLVLTLAMLLLPAVFTLFYRPRPGAGICMRRVRRLQARLWGWTGFSLAVYAVLALLRDSRVLAWWHDLPWITTFGKPMHELVWLAFFPLWFALAMPLITLCRKQPA